MIQEKEEERAAAQDIDPSQMEVPHDDFWIWFYFEFLTKPPP